MSMAFSIILLWLSSISESGPKKLQMSLHFKTDIAYDKVGVGMGGYSREVVEGVVIRRVKVGGTSCLSCFHRSRITAYLEAAQISSE